MSKSTVKNHLTAFLPSLIWAGVIFIFSAQQVLPSLHLSTLDFLFKKSAHMFVYGVLYWLVYRGLSQVDTPSSQKWWIAMIICLIYAASDEFHQSLVSGRSATLRDVGYDFLGAGLVLLRKKDYI